jgi:hypothetical protein
MTEIQIRDELTDIQQAANMIEIIPVVRTLAFSSAARAFASSARALSSADSASDLAFNSVKDPEKHTS